MSNRSELMSPWIERVALVLVIVGALNWGLVGLFEFDLVAEIVGEEFGEVNLASRVVYVLVAVAGIALIPALARRGSERAATFSQRAYE
jgi:uncharacterized membrane protein YuzA (DUF378 family)